MLSRPATGMTRTPVTTGVLEGETGIDVDMMCKRWYRYQIRKAESSARPAKCQPGRAAVYLKLIAVSGAPVSGPRRPDRYSTPFAEIAIGPPCG